MTPPTKTQSSFSHIQFTYPPNTLLTLPLIHFTFPTPFTANTKHTFNPNPLPTTHILNNAETLRLPLALHL
ncbi:BslA/BslB family hydrophobin, partial [Bacillus subtilis]|uniref:BslA/BslB family hydrophobin n=1 Tax=Bacillus subtilis TaxID=1423 RepID=UPI00338E0647